MKKFIPLLMLIVFFVSCKKNIDLPAPAIIINFDKAALSYVQIAINKYFIYKDSATGNTDSVVATESSIKNTSVPAIPDDFNTLTPGRKAYSYERFTLTLSTVKGNGPIDWFYGIANADFLMSYDVHSTDFGVLWLSEIDRMTNNNKGFVFKHPFVPGQLTPAMNIEGKDYADVILISSTNGFIPSSPNYVACSYYWAKGIGIIRRSITTSTGRQTWTLLRHG